MRHNTNKMLPALIASITLALAGCGGEVPQADVEKAAADTLAKGGHPGVTVACPSGLKGKVGASIACTGKIDEKLRNITVTAASIEGSTVNFEIAIAEGLPGAPAAK